LLVVGVCLVFAGWFVLEPSVDGIIAGALISVFLSFRCLHRRGQTLADSERDSLVINIGLGLALAMVLVIDKYNVSFLGEGADGESALVLGGVVLAGIFTPVLFQKRRLISVGPADDVIKICIGFIRIALIGIDLFLVGISLFSWGIKLDLRNMGFPTGYYGPLTSGVLLGSVVACGGTLVACRLIKRFKLNLFRFPGRMPIFLEFIGLVLCLPLLYSILFMRLSMEVFEDLEVLTVVVGLSWGVLLTVLFLFVYLHALKDQNFLFLKNTYEQHGLEYSLASFRHLIPLTSRLGQLLIGGIIVSAYFLFALSFAYDFGPTALYGYLAET